MIGVDEEFRIRLLATFREEADEHLTEITQDLLAIERAGPDRAAESIERAYRKTHSLKGAARAVKLQEIESVCQNLETVFSAMKKGEMWPDAEAFDLFHETLRVIRDLLQENGPKTTSAAEINRRIRLMAGDGKRAGLNGETSPEGKPDKAPAIPARPSPFERGMENAGSPTERSRPPSADELEIPEIPARGIPGQVPGGRSPAQLKEETRTVRVAAAKLDRLITGSDDLLTTRLFIAHRMRELEEMVTRFGIWRWNNALVSSDLHHLRETSFGKKRTELPPDLVQPLQRIVEFLEYNREFVTSLQHDLGAHIRDTEVDRAALEASTQMISDLIHDAVLLPISYVLVPFKGLVRDYSRSSGKQVDLIIEGGELEMDRRILETLKDPIMHLIHNSIDHGIEYPDVRTEKNKLVRGTVQIKVVPLAGSNVNIEISDDGAGINPRVIRKLARDKGFITAQEEAAMDDNEILWLVFRSGLSTSPMITDISGRGLGLAIVEDTATRLGGRISISSIQNKGTTITVTVPVRLATLRGVIVRSGSQMYVLPMQQVRQVMRVRMDAIIHEEDRSSIRFGGEMIRTIRLTDALGISARRGPWEGGTQIPVIILAYGAGQIACIVDEVVRVQEIVIRPLGSQLRHVKRITGAVTLGDGTLALVLDPIELIQESLKGTPKISQKPSGGRKEKAVLVVEDSVTSRALLQTIIEHAGYRVQTATDGIEAYAMLKEHQFDIVVSDIDMPRMNGFSLTEKIRADERLAHLPVVLVTSLDSPEDQNHGLSVGANAYIVKSAFEQKGILTIIAGLLPGQDREDET
jgi:two-component system, chemotaxis family, sensor kinase CheA